MTLKRTAVLATLALTRLHGRLTDRAIDLHRKLHWKLHNSLYRGAADDVFIVSFPRSGTTLMQMLMYQLLTDGNMETLSHIRHFSPFLERDVLRRFLADTRVTIDTMPKPHVVKSHLPYHLMPRGPGRYIYVMRNGLDVAVSSYFHTARAGSVLSFEQHYAMLLQTFNWFDHLEGWLRNRSGLNVLYVTYEDLRTEFAPTARRVAEFCGLTLSADEWSRVIERCSFEFMRGYEEKLDDLVVWRGDPEDLHFIRRGRVGDWRNHVTADVLRRFREEWSRTLAQLSVPGSLAVDDTFVPKALGSE